MKTKRFAILLCTLFLICMMSVLPAAAKSKPAPTKLVLSREKIMLYTGESKKLFVEKTKPVDAAAKVTWKTKNKKIAVVTKYGKITAKKPGKTIITAVSKKNPSVKAAVQVTVKKSPAKVEKECTVSGKGYNNGASCGLESDYLLACSLRHYPDGIIVRSREGFNEIRRVWNKSTGAMPFRKTELAEYADMDFTKESLVILTIWEEPGIYDFQVTSLTTKFDASGKLEGVISVRDNMPGVSSNTPSNAITTQVLEPFTVAVKIRKKDEAMIDYFRARGETYKDFIIAP